MYIVHKTVSIRPFHKLSLQNEMGKKFDILLKHASFTKHSIEMRIKVCVFFSVKTRMFFLFMFANH